MTEAELLAAESDQRRRAVDWVRVANPKMTERDIDLFRWAWSAGWLDGVAYARRKETIKEVPYAE